MKTSIPPGGTGHRLLQAAAAEIRRIGARRLSVSALAHELGMSHANVYRFFSSREALIDAVLHAWLTQLESRLSEIVDGPDPADDKLERFLATLIRAYGETARGDPAVFDLLAVPAGDGQEAVRHRRRVGEFLGRIVEEGMATRLFGGSEARRSVQLVLDLAHRFVDPAAVRLDLAEPPIPDLRRDRVVRAAIRALTAQR